MKATGIVRKIDNLGRFTIPREILKTMKISFGDPMEIFTNDDCIVLRRYQPEDTWSMDELHEALALACNDTGKDPLEYLHRIREGN